MSTLTDDEVFSIHQRLHGMYLPAGLGTEEGACSIAAINLALSGRLTDEIPACMSKVIGQWIIRVQDAMPDAMRNSDRWKNLLPLAAGTGRDREKERLEIILEWMWTTVLPTLQPLADRQGFGAAWQQMTTTRSVKVARAAWNAAWKAAEAAVRAAEWEAEHAPATAARAACEVAWAWKACEAAQWATEWEERAAVAEWSKAAETAAWAVEAAAATVLEGVAWETFDPCALLEKLVEVGK